jgi:hypothetical protein
MKDSKSLTILSFMALFVMCLEAFVVSPSQGIKAALDRSKMSMVGGRGWDNSDFLGGLSGDEDDREQANEDYNEYSESRKAFVERQKEIMKTPQGKAFLESQQQGRQMMGGMENMPPLPQDETPKTRIQPGSGGGSRMAQMMAQAQKNKQGMSPMGGFEQILAVPLDDDEDEESFG